MDEESFKCRYCGERADTNVAERRLHEMRRYRACLDCSFWPEKIQWEDNGDVTEDGLPVIRVGHQHYVIAPEDEKGLFRGHSGRKFVFKMKSSGKIVETTNLWAQGAIPKNFWEDLPDNAEHYVP